MDDRPPTSGPELSQAVQDTIEVQPAIQPAQTSEDLIQQVVELLHITIQQAEFIVSESERLYKGRMRQRFSELRVSERLKRTNPFLLSIRGAKTVKDWATLQIQAALFASEEEAVGHLLETIAKTCFPGATTPTHPDDFDFEATSPIGEVEGYQVKMSWDCMPMSSRKNLSNTIRSVRAEYSKLGKDFIGYFAPCYGKAKTSRPPGQDYISLSSREFWEKVGDGRPNYDVYVGQVCALLCSEFRSEVLDSLVPTLLDKLTRAAQSEIGRPDGSLDYERLFRRINR